MCRFLRPWRQGDTPTPTPSNFSKTRALTNASSLKIVLVEAPSSHRIDVIARRTIVLGWRPAAVRPYVRSSGDDRQHLVDSEVWDAMRRMLGEEALPYRGP
jgi:hypothetical protein